MLDSDNGFAENVKPCKWMGETAFRISPGNFLTKEIAGISGTGETRLGLKWRYSSPPTVTSTFKGRSNVSCSFVACLDSP